MRARIRVDKLAIGKNQVASERNQALTEPPIEIHWEDGTVERVYTLEATGEWSIEWDVGGAGPRGAHVWIACDLQKPLVQ